MQEPLEHPVLLEQLVPPEQLERPEGTTPMRAGSGEPELLEKIFLLQLGREYALRFRRARYAMPLRNLYDLRVLADWSNSGSYSNSDQSRVERVVP